MRQNIQLYLIILHKEAISVLIAQEKIYHLWSE